MAITRTVAQTVDGMLALYQKDIEAAAGDQVLTKAEEAKLTPFAKKHIDDARRAGQKMTVAKAVASLKPALTRAAKDIAGRDGMIDIDEVRNLRVAELRTRAASLFEEAPPADRAELDQALKDVDVAKITDYGRAFDLAPHAAGNTEESLISKITDISATDLGPLADWGTRWSGRAAVNKFASVIRVAAQEFLDNADDPADGADTKARLDRLADAIEKYFTPADYQQIVNWRHAIAEDGDVEYNVLMCVTRPPGGGQLMSTSGKEAVVRRPSCSAWRKKHRQYRVLRAASSRGGPRSVDRDCAGRNAEAGVKGLSPDNRSVPWWPSRYDRDQNIGRAKAAFVDEASTTGVRGHGMYSRPTSKRERSAQSRAGAPRPRLRDVRQGVNAESASILSAEVRCPRSSDEAGQCPWSEGGHGE